MEEWADVRMRKLKKCASVLCCEKVGETEAMVIERTMLEIAANLPAVPQMTPEIRPLRLWRNGSTLNVSRTIRSSQSRSRSRK